uniref:uncharacterized protein C5orf60-like n=1 Tax=Macaca mulatta TaxID=9544 RepID=UPI0010A25653|nr:uncharacterized protein C5orf60-like [Macaca mulatta]
MFTAPAPDSIESLSPQHACVQLPSPCPTSPGRPCLILTSQLSTVVGGGHAWRSLLKELENTKDHTLPLEKCLRKLLVEGSSHHLLRQDRPGPVYERAPARNHRPRGGCGKASPTSFHVSPQAPPAPLASMPSSVPKTSVESLGSLSSLSSSKPPEPLCPPKHLSHQPPASTLSPNPE